MKTRAFANRNLKELLRDPLQILFALGLPAALICMLSILRQRIGTNIFPIEGMAPGMAAFSFAFLTLFGGMLIANDRSTSFLSRLFAGPMRASEYILGYALPMLPIALLQGAVCLGLGLAFGLTLSWNLLLCLIALMPAALLYISLGLLLGSACTVSQVTGVGNLLIQASAWLSGLWFDLELIGGAFRSVCLCLPFAHATRLAVCALSGDYAGMLPHLWPVLLYAAAFFGLACWVFRKRMKG